jgi:aspartate aminotransferase
MISQKVAKIENSLTLKLSAAANKMKKEGIDVIDFGAGEPDFDTPENIKKAAIIAINSGKNKYTAASGILELKEAICQKLLKDNNLSYKPENIVISCGAKHSIFNSIISLIDPDDEVIIPSPYWVSYPDQVTFAGGKSVFINTDEKNSFKMTSVQFEKAITSKTKLLILNSPSNPTGMIYSKKELTEIAQIALKHNILVLSDEIYEKLIYSQEPHISIASLSPEIKEKTIVVNGLSKAYSMTGWRIGYLAASVEIAKAVEKIQSHSTSNPTTCAQWASIEALVGPQDMLSVMVKEFAKRRQYTVDMLNSIKGISCIAPDGAFYVFPNISGLFGKTSKNGVKITNSLDLCDILLKEALISCVPGSGFGAEGYMRLSYATSIEKITEGLNRLKTWVSQIS